MTTARQLIVSVFRDRTQAEQAIHELLQAGFDHHQIRFAERSGGILEKIKGLFTGQDMSAGGIYDDLVKMGTPPDHARYYQSEFEAGHSIVAVVANGRTQNATTILVRHGGSGIHPTAAPSTGTGPATGQRTTTGQGTATGEGMATGQGTATGQGMATSSTTAQQQATTESEQRLKLREEELRARKQPVETGEARIHKDVVTEQKSMEIPVIHEEVYVERRPGSGQPSDQPIGQGETYRIPVYEEQVTIEKQPIEREEVSFGKRPVQETKQVTETTQREEAHVEHTGDVNIRDTGAERGRGVERNRDIERGRSAERSRGTERDRGPERNRGVERDRDHEDS